MSYLNWISDHDLEAEVGKILNTAKEALTNATNDFDRNVIDPFAVMFEMAGFNIHDVSIWITTEKSRKAQKTLSNAFGTFHQSVIGHIEGWVDLGTGKSADLECQQRKFIAEIKNKYNTVKGSDQVIVYDHLQSLVMPITSKYREYTAYYVETIPRPKAGKPQSYNEPFTPSDKETKTKRPVNELIRRIDGKSFYALATGDEHALFRLYEALPEVIKKVAGIEIKQSEINLMKQYFEKAFLR